MGRCEQHPGVLAYPEPDTPQPALYLIVFLALAGIPDDYVQGTAGKKNW